MPSMKLQIASSMVAVSGLASKNSSSSGQGIIGTTLVRVQRHWGLLDIWDPLVCIAPSTTKSCKAEFMYRVCTMYFTVYTVKFSMYWVCRSIHQCILLLYKYVIVYTSMDLVCLCINCFVQFVLGLCLYIKVCTWFILVLTIQEYSVVHRGSSL